MRSRTQRQASRRFTTPFGVVAIFLAATLGVTAAQAASSVGTVLGFMYSAGVKGQDGGHPPFYKRFLPRFLGGG